MALKNTQNIIEEITIEASYEKAENLRKAVKTLIKDKERAEIYAKLAKMYKSFGDYKDSEKLYDECITQQKRYERYIEEGKIAESQKQAATDEDDSESGKGKHIFVMSIIVLIIACVAGGAIYLKTEPGRYARAAFYNKRENFEKSYKMFENLKDYKDSSERATEGRYEYALQLVENKEYDEAISMLRKLDGYKDSGAVLADTEIIKLAAAKVGDDLLFGEAHWIVLEKKADKVMLGKLKPLRIEGAAYNTVSKDITWEECSLRKYLNNELIEEIFNESMAEKIITTEVSVPDNTKHNTKGGNKTQDKLFLLNSEQAEQYGEMLSDYLEDWWLINPGSKQNTAQFVSYGKVMSDGYDVSSDNIFIRPAMWVLLEK